jgi:hypothetical protein
LKMLVWSVKKSFTSVANFVMPDCACAVVNVVSPMTATPMSDFSFIVLLM